MDNANDNDNNNDKGGDGLSERSVDNKKPAQTVFRARGVNTQLT
jgi:hypothetical protein